MGNTESGNPSGNSRQRRQFKKQVAMALKTLGVAPVPSPQAETSKPSQRKAPESSPKREKFNEALGLISFACTVGSWGWSVVAPDSSIIFGSVLLFAAVVAMLLAVHRIWQPGKLLTTFITIVVLTGFGMFDWFVVVQPQRGKPFKELLVSGYHLTNECGSRSAKEPMPTWMRDQSKGWQAQVEQIISQKLDYKYLQMWQGSAIVGLVTDDNLTAYQCTLLSVKVGALETIIAQNYDPSLKHQDYEGPLYWLESVDGQVDISEALKHGGRRFTIHEKPKPNAPVSPGSGRVQIHGKVPT